jgi:hypothetical protein
LERRQGKRVTAKGIYRDPVRSSHGHFVKTSALRWVCVTLLAEVPWARRVWSLPFISTLAPSERYATEQGKRRGFKAQLLCGTITHGGASFSLVSFRATRPYTGVGSSSSTASMNNSG